MRTVKLDAVPFNPPPASELTYNKNYTGCQVGRWLVVGLHSRAEDRELRWVCRCSCGQWRVVGSESLGNGSRSCGCLRLERSQAVQIKHGRSRSREYASFQGARQRCLNPHDQRYSDYGGRGIEFRFASFEEFLNEVGFRPTPQHSIDRIDVNGHYEPGNVRWATPKEQQANRRYTATAELNGERRPVTEWAELLNLPRATLITRLKRGWSDERALTTPLIKYAKNKRRVNARSARAVENAAG